MNPIQKVLSEAGAHYEGVVKPLIADNLTLNNQVVLISGEPGCGKVKAVRDLLSEKGENFEVLNGGQIDAFPLDSIQERINKGMTTLVIDEAHKIWHQKELKKFVNTANINIALLSIPKENINEFTLKNVKEFWEWADVLPQVNIPIFHLS